MFLIRTVIYSEWDAFILISFGKLSYFTIRIGTLTLFNAEAYVVLKF